MNIRGSVNQPSVSETAAVPAWPYQYVLVCSSHFEITPVSYTCIFLLTTEFIPERPCKLPTASTRHSRLLDLSEQRRCIQAVTSQYTFTAWAQTGCYGLLDWQGLRARVDNVLYGLYSTTEASTVRNQHIEMGLRQIVRQT
jgi:hypothetical protein